jgi:hypothetical protein
MAKEPKRRTSFDLAPGPKRKLEAMKSELRFEGFAGVTEGTIIESLIEGAKLADLKRHFKKRPSS